MTPDLTVHPKNHFSSSRIDTVSLKIQKSFYQSKRLKIEHYLEALRNCGVHHSTVEYTSDYLRHLLRRNRSMNTLKRYFVSIKRLAVYLKAFDNPKVEHINRDCLGAFIEHLQDSGLMPSSINCILTDLYIFFGFLIEKGVLDPKIMRNKFRLKTPDELPKAIDPEDVKKILSKIDTPREKALILVLLRTGMRIGELLGTRIKDIDLEQRKIEIYEAQKTHEGRVVYMSDDACNALRAWIKRRKPGSAYVFYGYGNDTRLSYARARALFIKYVKKAGLNHKSYTLHSLRHTFASELLNAGMRLECLQVLLGHQNIEVTRRYARLTDNARKEEYYRAIERIERGEINGHYRFHN